MLPPDNLPAVTFKWGDVDYYRVAAALDSEIADAARLFDRAAGILSAR